MTHRQLHGFLVVGLLLALASCRDIAPEDEFAFATPEELDAAKQADTGAAADDTAVSDVAGALDTETAADVGQSDIAHSDIDEHADATDHEDGGGHIGGPCDGKPDNTKCDDSNACTKDDVCKGGFCKGVPDDCDDNKFCTKDTCDKAKGCQHENLPQKTACDDNNKCTTNDECEGDQCFGDHKVCDDKNPCTADICMAKDGKCASDTGPHNNKPCDDGNKCTEKTTCNAGVCSGTAKTCDDGKPCTQDSCDKAKGCVTKNVDGKCDDDDNACNGVGTCKDGKCAVGKAVPCDDKNPCTDDSCDKKKGCVHANNTKSCSDGDPCTTASVCKDGKCAGAGPGMWDKTLANPGDDDVQALLPMADGGFIAIGRVATTKAGYDGAARRFDGGGKQLWSQTYGDLLDDDASAAAMLAGGKTFVIAGALRLKGEKHDRPRLVWVSVSDGKQTNTKVSGGGTSQAWYTSLVTTSERIYAAGAADKPGANLNGWLQALDHKGKETWSTSVGGLGHQTFDGLVRTKAGTWAVGSHQGNDQANKDAFIAVIDDKGVTKWTRTFGGAGNDQLRGGAQTASGMIFAGRSDSYSPNADIWLVGTNSAGVVTWQRTIRGDFVEADQSVRAFRGGLLIAAHGPQGDAKPSAWLLDVDGAGQPRWQTHFSGNGMVMDAAPMGDKRLGVAIRHYASKANGYDWRLLRTDTFGNTDCKAAKDCAAKKFGACSDSSPCTTDSCTAATGCYSTAQKGGCSDGSVCSTDGVCSGKACATGAKRLWSKSIDANDDDEASAVLADYAGGHYVAGLRALTAAEGGKGGQDMWVARFGTDGQQQWQALGGGKRDDAARALVASGDGSVIAAGETQDAKGQPQAMAMRVDKNGKGTWTTVFGSNGPAVFRAAIGVTTTTFALVGESVVPGKGQQAWAVVIDANGKQLLVREFGTKDSDDTGMDVVRLASGELAIVGETDADWSKSGNQVSVWQVDNTGKEIGQWSFGGPEDDFVERAVARPDGGLFVVGSRRKKGTKPGSEHGQIIAVDGKGKALWSRADGSFRDLHGVVHDGLGSIVVAGLTTGDRPQIRRYSAKGDVIGSRGYTKLEGEFTSIALASRHTLLLTGILTNKDNEIGLFMATDLWGNAQCDKGLCLAAAATPLTCADSHKCTISHCQDSTGCGVQTLNSQCSDKDACTNDVCDAKKGCVFTPAKDGTPCQDGKTCTAAATCKAAGGKSTCQGGKPALWELKYTTTSATELFGAAVNSAGALAVAGHYDASGAGGGYAKVTRLDGAGGSLWTYTRQSSANQGIAAMSDGGYVAVGHNPARQRAHITRLNGAGKVTFEKTFGKTAVSAFNAVLVQGADIVAAGKTVGGTSGAAGGGQRAGWVVRLDAQGNVKSEALAVAAGVTTEVRGMTAAPNGEIFAVGISGPVGGSRGWLFGASKAGSVKWQRSVGSAGQRSDLEAVVYRQPHFIAVGSFGDHPKREGRIVAFDQAGGQLWERSLGTTAMFGPQAIVAAGSILYVAGMGMEKVGVPSQGFFARVSLNGDIQHNLYGGPAGDRFWGMALHGTRMALVGGSYPTAVKPPVGWLVHADLHGNITCATSGSCSDQAPGACSDGQSCTIDSCAIGKCVHKALQDNTVCTGSDLCQAGACSNGKCAQIKPRDCGDGNDCTNDSCDVAAGCVNTASANVCNGTLWKGRCFEASYGGERTWPAAEAACAKAGGHLASVDSAGENDAAHRERNRVCGAWSFAWIGLNDVAKEGDYAWSDKTKFGFKAWADGEPNNAGNEDYVLLARGKAAWMDYNKTDVSCHVCERPVPVCDDAAECSAGGICGPGGCVMSKGPACDDDNGCTLDKCDPKNGSCSTVPIKTGAACDDGDPCTLEGTCDKNGECRAIESFNCDDAKPCTADNCVPGKGCVNVVPKPGCDGTEHMGSCLKVFTNAGSFASAVDRCVEWGGDLASITLAANNTNVQKLVQKANCSEALIGLNDRGKDGAWKWRDLSKVGLLNWAKGEPSNHLKGFGDENIVVMRSSDGKWADRWAGVPSECVVCSRRTKRACATDGGCLAGTCEGGTCKQGTDSRLGFTTIAGQARYQVDAGAAAMDGSVVVAGSTSSKDLGATEDWDAYAALIRPDRTEAWHITRTGNANSTNEHFRTASVLGNGLIVLAGTLAHTATSNQGYVEILARDGTTVATKGLGTNTDVYGSARDGDGALLVGGGFQANKPNPLTLNVNSKGVMVGPQEFAGIAYKVFVAATKVGNTFFIAGENTKTQRVGWFRMVNGIVYPDGEDDDAGRNSDARAIAPATTGVFIAGFRWPAASGPTFGNGHIWRLASNGKKMWDKTQTSFLEIHDIMRRHDGAFLVAGKTHKKGGMIITMDETATFKTGGFNDGLQLSKLVMLPDLNVAVIGMTGSANSENGIVRRVTAWGHQDCSAAGKCKSPGPTNCDDGKICTFDNCHAAGGCSHKDYAATLPCGDGKKCTKKATCE